MIVVRVLQLGFFLYDVASNFVNYNHIASDPTQQTIPRKNLPLSLRYIYSSYFFCFMSFICILGSSFLITSHPRFSRHSLCVKF